MSSDLGVSVSVTGQLGGMMGYIYLAPIFAHLTVMSTSLTGLTTHPGQDTAEVPAGQ